ncbi:hypothetical protein NQZ68_030975 [Dissostichus eleginoides]|nr:hypothetical protein NQZ68_030975 [Dissostichus eleginoides]
MWTGSHSRPLPAPVAVTDARAAYSLQLSRPSPARAVGKAAEHPETMDSPFSGKSASASKEPREACGWQEVVFHSSFNISHPPSSLRDRRGLLAHSCETHSFTAAVDRGSTLMARMQVRVKDPAALQLCPFGL